MNTGKENLSKMYKRLEQVTCTSKNTTTMLLNHASYSFNVMICNIYVCRNHLATMYC